MDLFDLYARISLDTSDYEEGIQKSQSGFGKLKDGISSIAKVAAGIGAAVATVSTLLVKVGVESAAEVRAETSAFQQTFGEMQNAASDAIARVANQSGILQTRLNTLGSQIYAFARSSGGDATQSLSLMERALQVAADSAAYYDTSVEQATETLQSFLKGNFANDAALGLSATETTRNAAAMELFGQKYAELTEIQKQETLLKMVEDAQRLSGAMGQAAREADGWENVIGNLKESWRQLKARIGEPVLDTVTPIIQDATKAVSALTENWDQVERAIGNAAIILGTFTALLVSLTIVQKFQEAKMAVELFAFGVDQANLVMYALNGTMTVGQTVVALLTGKITLAQIAVGLLAKAQAGLNAVMSANPIGLVITAVGLLGVAIHNSISEVDALADSMVVQASSAAEAEENLAALQARFAEFEGNPNKWGAEKQQEYRALKQAIAETEEQLAQLQQTEAEAAAAAAEAAVDPVNVFRSATEQYAQDATALYENFVATYEGMFNQVSGWFKPFSEAAASVETSIDDMMSAMQSQIDFNNTYSANLLALKEYGLGSLSEAFQSYGANGAAYAQTIVEAVEQAGGATTQKGQEIIQGFADINQKVTESQGELSQTMALLSGEFESQLQSMGESYSAAIADLGKGEEAKTAAETTFQSFLDGMNSKIPGILAAMNSIGNQIKSSLQSGIGSITIPINITTNSSGTGYAGRATGTGGSFISSHAGGLDFVPYDGYIAELHRGEAVLTSEEASAMRRGAMGSRGVTVNQYIYSEAKTAADLMQEARYAQERAVLLGV